MRTNFAHLPIVLPASAPIDAFFTLRSGGCSVGAFGATEGRDGLNLGAACGDDPESVRKNRAAVERGIGRPVLWLRQVHGASVCDADAYLADGYLADGFERPAGVPGAASALEVPQRFVEAPEADALFTTRSDIALAIMVADCLPIVIAARDGSIVGAAHAGWRGLAGGVVSALGQAMRARRPEVELVAWLGPRIGASAFEVGDEVRQRFLADESQAVSAFVAGPRPGKWIADLGLLASQALRREGIEAIHDTRACTVLDPQRFWSYRRDRECGRMAAIVARRADPERGDADPRPDHSPV